MPYRAVVVWQIFPSFVALSFPESAPMRIETSGLSQAGHVYNGICFHGDKRVLSDPFHFYPTPQCSFQNIGMVFVHNEPGMLE